MYLNVTSHDSTRFCLVSRKCQFARECSTVQILEDFIDIITRCRSATFMASSKERDGAMFRMRYTVRPGAWNNVIIFYSTRDMVVCNVSCRRGGTLKQSLRHCSRKSLVGDFFQCVFLGLVGVPGVERAMRSCQAVSPTISSTFTCFSIDADIR